MQDHAEIKHIHVPRDLIRHHRLESLSIVTISGDSMTGERIDDGDIVIFSSKVKEGDGVYVLSVANTLLCKRVEFDAKGKAIVLISANPAYELRRYEGADLEDIRIEGCVVACCHRM